MVDYIVFFSLILFALVLFIISCIRPVTVERLPPDDISKCESPIERRVYLGLLQHGLHATTQYGLGKYRIDIAFPSEKIAIECDGKAFHSSPQQKAYDRKRDKYMRDQGWRVLRFSGKRIYRDLPGVVDRIKRELEEV